MGVSPALQEGIDEIVGAVPAKELERAARALSDSYRGGGATASRAARSPGDVAAYLATRAPATYAAVADVCGRVAAARPGWQPRSLLDLGAGPGIATWAALATWQGIEEVTLVEAEPSMVAAGRQIAVHGAPALRNGRWQAAAVGTDPLTAPTADLVVASYLLGELAPAALPGLLEQAWSLTGDTLLIVEPGTTEGYRRMLLARDAALAGGGSVLAPCPHERACPLPPGDWCHFSTRLQRSRTHRLAKGAERGFEDEKLSYVVCCRTPQARPQARVIRRPDLRPGHVVLDLCAPEGLEQRTVSKRDGATYRAARKLAWGDTL
jgi:ribosomal protein RSM22 (predicted rRNA methylase)